MCEQLKNEVAMCDVIGCSNRCAENSTMCANCIDGNFAECQALFEKERNSEIANQL